MSSIKNNPAWRMRLQWAKYAARQFRFQFPQYEVFLYEFDSRWYLLITNPNDNLEELSTHFDQKIRPMTCPINLVEAVANGTKLVDETESYSDEVWLAIAPKNSTDLNNCLFLSSPGLPKGGLDYSFDHDCWVFRSHHAITDENIIDLINSAVHKIGLDTPVRLEVWPPTESIKSSYLHFRGMNIPTSSTTVYDSKFLKTITESDEDEWRAFLSQRENQNISKNDSPYSKFACLFDTSDQSKITISELLTIYDRIDLIPDRTSYQWMEKHGLTLNVFQELVELGRLRVILPFAAYQYRQDILENVVEANPKALILSRALASKTIIKGQYKEPLLYAPLKASQRIELLQLLSEIAPSEKYKLVLDGYGRIFKDQHYAYMINGANANLGYGIGSYLGELIYQMQDSDARLELSHAGALMEWGLGLGSTYIPKQFGDYDETHNCHLIASYMGRVKGKPVDPVAPRMHQMIDGLLAVSNVPPLEVARNFKGNSINRFRKVALNVLNGASTNEEMQAVVDQINLDVKSFESKSEKLAKWKIDNLAVSIVAKPISDLVDSHTGYFSSAIAAWIYQLMKDRMTKPVSNELNDALQILLGLAVGPLWMQLSSVDLKK